MKRLFNNLSSFIKIFLSTLIVIYLISVPIGFINKNDKRITPTDLGLIAILVLLNSDLIERITKFSLNNGSINLELVERKQTANLIVNQKEVQALAFLGDKLLGERLLENEDNNKKNLRDFFSLLLNDGDREILKKFETPDENKDKLIYQKSDQQLLLSVAHLHLLGFLQTPLESMASKISSKNYFTNHYDNFPLDKLEEGDKLIYIFYLSDLGKKCLEYTS